MHSDLIKILAIDPGSNISGFACIASTAFPPYSPKDFSILEIGTAKFKKNLTFAEKVGQAFEFAQKLISTHNPTHCVIEKAFYGDNVNTAIKLGEIRGALISACSQSSAQFNEITPAEVKKLITGNGRADKDDVSFAVKSLFNIKKLDLAHDATDALAIALSYALQIKAENTRLSKTGQTLRQTQE